jgi:hypothetical protein
VLCFVLDCFFTVTSAPGMPGVFLSSAVNKNEFIESLLAGNKTGTHLEEDPLEGQVNLFFVHGQCI